MHASERRRWMGAIAFLLMVVSSPELAAQALPEQQGAPSTGPTPRRGGFGITIDLGSLMGAIRDAIQKDGQEQDGQDIPPLAKTAVGVSPVSGGGYTIDWVIQYANTTGTTQPGVTIVDGPIATILPASLQQPPGWTGTTNANPPMDNWVKWTGSAPPIVGYLTATFPTSSPSTFNPGPAAGDGYLPIPYRRAGVLRIYYFNHHIGGALPPNDVNVAKPFGCIDTQTGAPCPGFPRPLPKGDGSGQPSATAFYPEEYVLQGGQLYYAVTAKAASGWDFGLGCYDLNSDTECGFYPLGHLPGHTGEAYVKGPWKVGNELYLLDASRRLYCMGANNPSVPCSGLSTADTGFLLPATAFPYPGPLNYWGPAVFGEVVGNRLYLTTDSNPVSGWAPVSKMLRTYCFDAATKAACAGWTVVPRNVTTVRTVTFLHYDATMTPRHVCTRLTGTTQNCVDVATGAVTTPAVVMPLFFSKEGFGTEVTVGTRTYFPDYHLGDHTVKCWDWATGAACVPTSSYPAWTAGPKNYAVNVDDRGCLWVMGDNASATWDFDPAKPLAKGKAQRCGGSESSFIQVFEPWRYCSGPKPFAWTRLEVANATLAQFTKLILRVKDGGGNTLFTFDALASAALSTSIAGIDPQTNGQPLRVEVDYALAPGASVAPELRAYYRASPLEFCFKSTHGCAQGPVANTVGVPERPDLGIAPVTVHVPLPSGCPAGGGHGDAGAGGGIPSDGVPAGPSTGGGAAAAGGTGMPAGAGGVVGAILGGASANLPTPECPPGMGGCKPAQSRVDDAPRRCHWRPKVKAAADTAPKATRPRRSVTQPASAGKTAQAKTVRTASPATTSGVKPKVRPKPRPKPQPEMEWVCEE